MKKYKNNNCNKKLKSNLGEELAPLIKFMTIEDIYSMKIQDYITDILIEQRLKLGYNRKQFAEYLKVPLNSVIQWEDNIYNFNIDELIGICEKLKLRLKITIN